MSDIHIGYEIMEPYLNEEGETVVDPTSKVSLDVSHIFISGTTGTGKSKTMRAIIERSNQKFLILDAKRPRDYEGFGSDIPLFIRQQMKALNLKDLIESTERISIKKEFPMLSRLIRKSTDWQSLLELAREIQNNPKTRDFYKDILETLIVLFEELVAEYSKYTFSESIKLPNKYNVMNISELSPQLQQIVVSSTVNYVHENMKNVIIVIDEAHRFIPQTDASGCMRDIVKLIREGRANGCFLWVADQTVTGVSKQVLKQMQFWVLGRQGELNEAQRTVKQIPRAKSLGITVDMIQTLDVGEFLIVTPKWAKKTYIWPLWITEDIAQMVAMRQMDVEEVSKLEPIGDDEDLKYKAELENERKLRKETEKHAAELTGIVQHQTKELDKMTKRIKDLEERIKDFQEHGYAGATATQLTKTVAPETGPNTDDTKVIEKTDEYTRVYNPDAGWQLTAEARTEIMDIVDSRISQLTLDETRIVVVPLDSAIREKIVDDYLDLITKNLTGLKEPAKVSARFIYKGRRVPYGDLLFHVRNRRGKPDAPFTRDYINPLITNNLIRKTKDQQGYILEWMVETQLRDNFREILEPDEIQKVVDFVHSLIL
jgi:hypothetical protein